MIYTADIESEVAFSQIKGVSPTRLNELRERLGGAATYFELSGSELISRYGLRDGVLSDSERRALLESAKAEVEFCNKHNIAIHSPASEFYPERLKGCEDAPLCLFCSGDATLNGRYMLAIVGTRHCTPTGVSFIDTLVKDLAEKVGRVTIVSGLAYGADIAAHRAALRNGLPTIAVMAHGLSMIYPAQHRSDAVHILKSGGAIVTEYMASARPNRGTFLARNRIIAGMSDATIVVESDVRGGALATARLAGEYNREVFAVPGRPFDKYSQGCNNLIRTNRAMLLTDADQLIEVMNWPRLNAAPVQKSLFAVSDPKQLKVLEYLRDHPTDTVNDMTANLGIPYNELSAMLFELEMDDVVAARPGGTYTLLKTDF